MKALLLVMDRMSTVGDLSAMYDEIDPGSLAWHVIRLRRRSHTWPSGHEGGQAHG